MTCRVIYDSAEALRVEGNELFKQGNLEDAAACWRQALAKIAEAPDSERLDGPEADNLSKCESACISNISLYHFQQGDWQSCIKWCDIVLTGGDNLKARFRRAQVSLVASQLAILSLSSFLRRWLQAHLRLGNSAQALTDLEAALSMDPDNDQLCSSVDSLKQTIEEESQGAHAYCLLDLSSALHFPQTRGSSGSCRRTRHPRGFDQSRWCGIPSR